MKMGRIFSFVLRKKNQYGNFVFSARWSCLSWLYASPFKSIGLLAFVVSWAAVVVNMRLVHAKGAEQSKRSTDKTSEFRDRFRGCHRYVFMQFSAR